MAQSIEGTVTDSDGTALERATVTVTDEATGDQEAQTLTAADGTYSVSVSASTYDVLAEKPSYEDDEQTSVTVQTDATETVDLTLTAFQPKVIGRQSSQTSVGVLGEATAETGTPIALKGSVDAADGWGLFTANALRIGGFVDTDGEDFVVETGTTFDGDPGNVVAGHASNSVQNAVGATISGGGKDNGNTTLPNIVSSNFGTIGGGSANEASAPHSTVGGGQNNTTSNFRATVSGGRDNTASGIDSTVGGGDENTASDSASTVGGGSRNTASANVSTVSGGGSNSANGNYAAVGGGFSNDTYGGYDTIAGGRNNRTGTSGTGVNLHATISGGQNNTASAGETTVGGGDNNTASGDYATVSGGRDNTASGGRSTIGGGSDNFVNGLDATVAGGDENAAYATDSTIGGGGLNRTGQSGETTGNYATVPGGFLNTAEGRHSFAAGRRAKARQDGAFVWADDTFADFESNQAGTSGSPTGVNTFHVRATGGLRFVTGLDDNDDPNAGQYLDAGGSTWQTVSAASAKHDVRPVDPEAILSGVESLSVSRWAYDANPGVDRMGPMAGEFSETFGLGDDPETIGHVDADGVALAAIKGLAERLADARMELDRKTDRIDELEDRLTAVEDHLSLDVTTDS